jgi:hypothetical protein
MASPVLPLPAAVHGAAFLIVATGIVMIVGHSLLLARAGLRTTLSPQRQILVPVLVAFALSAWFAWAILAVPDWVQLPEPAPASSAIQNPGLLLEMAALVVAGIVALFASKSLRELNAVMPPAWLIAVQFYRVLGLIFLWPMWSSGVLSGTFALPAGIGDVLTGLAAPLVAWAVARRRPGSHGLAVAWNWFGIADLVVAPAAAVLAHSTNVGRFPLVVVPLFLGPPLGILTHIYSLRNLRISRNAAVSASRPSSVAPGVF